MKKFNLVISKSAEYYLIALVILAFYSPTFQINPIAIGLIIILTLQIIFRNKTSGLLIAALFILINLYMFLALLSEFSEFPAINFDSLQLLLVGLFIIGLNLYIAKMMIHKYLQPVKTSKCQTEAGK